jgi:hypothetical protein
MSSATIPIFAMRFIISVIRSKCSSPPPEVLLRVGLFTAEDLVISLNHLLQHHFSQNSAHYALHPLLKV